MINFNDIMIVSYLRYTTQQYTDHNMIVYTLRLRDHTTIEYELFDIKHDVSICYYGKPK